EMRYRCPENRAMAPLQPPGAHQDQRGGRREQRHGGDEEGAHRACHNRERRRMATRAWNPPVAWSYSGAASPPVSSSSSLRLSSAAFLARSKPLLHEMSTSLGDLALTPRSTAGQLDLLPNTNACSTSLAYALAAPDSFFQSEAKADVT